MTLQLGSLVDSFMQALSVHNLYMLMEFALSFLFWSSCLLIDLSLMRLIFKRAVFKEKVNIGNLL
jgi:cytochrome c oxidase assembly factor CtaG